MLPCCNVKRAYENDDVLGIHLEAYHWRLRPPHMPPADRTGALPLHPLT